jgi:farnesyl-diphosphate farnesyltransferase
MDETSQRTAVRNHGTGFMHERNTPALSLLKGVSRSFYLTLRVLPRAVRFQIGLAYLLARTSDTIADTDLVPVEERLEALRRFAERLMGQGVVPLNFQEFLTSQSGSLTLRPEGKVIRSGSALVAERSLLLRVEELLNWLDRIATADRELIRAVLSTIISGQELDLRRFGRASGSQIVALADAQALDDYTYRVAGCVGEFWSRICGRHLFPGHPINEAEFIGKGIRFGKGLQLVNVLRDLPADLRQGRCYLPENRLRELGIVPSDLLEPANYQRIQSFYNDLLELAQDHLSAGWDYTNMLPRRCVRLRLACAWPILIGLATVAKLRAGNVLDASRRIKVSRSEVRKLMLASIAGQVLPGVWGRLPARAQMV